MANIVRRNEQGREMAEGHEGRRWDPFQLMREMMRWDPFRDLDAYTVGPDVFSPRFEVRETKEGYVIRADLPGVKDENIEVSVTANRLVVSGRREQEQHDEGERYYAAELSYGSFSRSFTLPDGCDAEHVRAELKNGVLEIVVPKRPEVQPRKIALGKGAETPTAAGGGKAKA